MANLKVDTKNLFEKFSSGLKKQAGSLFWLVFLGILVYEFFVAQQALQDVLWPTVKAPPLKSGVETKLNFSDYDLVVKRITDARNYQLQTPEVRNPFRPSQR